MRPGVTRLSRRHRGLLSFSAVVALVAAAAIRLPSPAQAQWSLGPPDVMVGEDPGVPFEDIVSVFVRGDLVYVADQGSGQIHSFALANGHHVATAGSEGEGPGEFQALAWISDCGGDSVFASDDILNRVSVYTVGLNHLRTFRVAAPAGNLSTIQCIGPQGFIAISRHRDPALSGTGGLTVGGTYRSTFDVVVFSREGTFREAIGPFLGSERYRSPSAASGRYSDVSLLWGRYPVLGSSEWGFVLGTNDEWSLARYHSTSDQPDSLTLAEARKVVSDSHRAAYVQRRVQRSEDTGRPTAPTRQYWQEYPYPTLFPAYSKVIALPDGTVWVEEFAAPYLGQIAQWKVFAPDGTLAGTVDLPERFQIMWVGETHVAGIAMDTFGVQTVEVRPILR